MSTMVFTTFRGSILGALLLVLRSTVCLDTATVSITAVPDYSIEPDCVQSCVFKTYAGIGIGSFLLSELGCQSTIYNACYCTQLADHKASTFLSSCVNSLCTGTTEISNAISLYQTYCNGAGYPRSVAAAQTTSASSSATTVSSSQLIFFTATATPASASAPTPTSSSPTNLPSVSPSSTNSPPAGAPSPTLAPTSSNTGTNPKPKLVPIIGGAVGGVAALAILGAILYLVLRKNRQASISNHGAATTVSMQSLVRPKVELENHGVRPAENAILAPPKPFTEVNGERRYAAEHRELDNSSKYVGELYGGGRPVRGVELPENNGWKV